MNIVTVKKDKVVIAQKVEFADTFLKRLLGLMFSKNLGNKDGLLFYPSNSIHTFFMNYPIDVIFLNNKNEVVKVIPSMKPWRITRIYFGACKVIELMGGSLKEEIKTGDKLEILCLS